MPKISRALISVSDKKGIVELAQALAALKVEILSTGGTAKLLQQNGVPVVEVSAYTGQPEILDGRLKTLHPKIHGGLLAIRGNRRHMEEIKKSGIGPIDLVVVNLYPFEATVSREAPFEEVIENIDIGGPSMIRAAAKNWVDVAALVDPADYGWVMEELKGKGGLSKETHFRLAQKAFALTAHYDTAIANHLTRLSGPESAPKKFPDRLGLQVVKAQELRYGENPHQAALFYREDPVGEPCVANARQLHGKELSYNNILDLDTAIEAVKDFSEPACVILKHNNPCGVARGKVLKEIFVAARSCDPEAAFGGIIGLNRPVDRATAEEIGKDFYECVAAPLFEPEALEILKSKKNIRLMQVDAAGSDGKRGSWTLQKVCGGLLVQERDLDRTPVKAGKVVTKRSPTDVEWEALEFAWRVVKWVKSNAIVFASRDRTLGIGAGQMSRVDAVRIGLQKARVPLTGAAMASDAFFPFRDNVDEAAKHGIRVIVQPGGSIRDADSIAAADEAGIAMVFTGIRHFRH